MDLLITNARVVDPETDFCGPADVGIQGGRIVYVGSGSREARSVINAQGLTLVPGFIDSHIHVDPLEQVQERGDGPRFFTLECMARMGVTSAVAGHCGLGISRPASYLDLVDRRGAPTHLGTFAGYTSIRQAAGVHDPYAPMPRESLLRAREYAHRAMREGAMGISLGLEYTPGASTSEVIVVSGVAAEYPGALLSAHYRHDVHHALSALDELIIISRDTGTPLQVSHLGSCCAFGHMAAALEKLGEARLHDIDVMADCYPYNSFCTHIGSAAFDAGSLENWGIDYADLLVASGPRAGQRLDRETFRLLRGEQPETLVTAFVMDLDEVYLALQHPLVLVASDGIYANSGGHPRGAGTFPRVLGPLVRDLGLFDFKTALAKVTIEPARRLGLARKGRLSEGADADLVLLDPDQLEDEATHQEPTRPPRGIQRVLVEGREVVREGRLTGARPGRPLLGPRVREPRR